MSRQVEPQKSPATSSSSGAFWIGGALFVVGMAVGGWGAFKFFAQPTSPSSVPTFAADKDRDQPSRVPNETRQMKLGVSPSQRTFDLDVDAEPKRPLRNEGPINLTNAVLLNGGASAQSNYFSHHLHIKMFRELLLRRGLSKKQLSVFSTDGEDRAPDQLISSSLPMSWLFSGLREDQLVNATKLINTTLKGQRMYPAKRGNLSRYFRRLARKSRRLKKPSTTLLFVTDHGTRGRGPLGNKIELWNQQLTVKQLQGMLRPLGRKHRVISVMSQCYSGGFANILYTRRWRVHGNRCGFFSTLSNREAYGCFPETAHEDRVGHAYRFIRAMRDSRTYDEAHRRILLRDRTPDVPIATSDIFLEDIMRKRARRRRVKPAVEIDRWLVRVWRKPPAWLKGEIALLRRIQRSFQLKPYRYTAKVWREIRRNRSNLKQLQSLETIWKQVWSEVQRSSLMSFYQRNDRIEKRVVMEMNRPQIDAQTRQVGRLLYKSFVNDLKRQPATKKRMSRLHKRFDLVQKQSHLYHTYEAALLRVAMRLTRIAGLYYLRHGRAKARYKRSLKQLLTCERTPIRGRPFRAELRAEGPRKKSKAKPRKIVTRRLPLRSVTPSRLGIGFQPAPRGWHPTFAKTAPGAVLVNGVETGSPADKAGLRRGDVIAAVGGHMLKLDSEIRDLVMLSPPNKKIFFMVYRGNRFVTKPVKLAVMGGLTPAQPGQPRLGMAPPQPGQPGQGDPSAPPPGFGPDGSMGNGQPGSVPRYFHDDGQGGTPHGFYADPDTQVYGLRRRRLRRKPTRRGTPPGNSALVTMSGKAIQFPAKKGATLLFFWATWCGGCKAMVPMLRRLQRRFRGKGLTFLAVTSDTPALLRPFKRKWGRRFPFKIAIDRGGRLSRRYHISAIPRLLLFSKSGKLVFNSSHLSSSGRRRLISTIRRYAR